MNNFQFFIKLILCGVHLLFGLMATSLLRLLLGRYWFAGRVGKKFKILWLSVLSKILGLNISVNGTFSQTPLLIVSNHISWLDIIVIGSLQPIVFVARNDVGNWPLIGLLAKLSGTLFVDRNVKRDVPEIIRQAKDILGMDAPVIFFPEATTSDGLTLRKFRPSLFQISIDAKCTTQSVALAYPRTNGRASCAPYINDDVFFHHFLKVLKTRVIDVQVLIAEPIAIELDSDRKALANLSQQQIVGMLKLH